MKKTDNSKFKMLELVFDIVVFLRYHINLRKETIVSMHDCLR